MKPDPMKPGATLLVKLGSIVVHADEATGPDGHAFDVTTIQSLISDPEVAQWIADMGVLLPRKRADRGGS